MPKDRDTLRTVARRRIEEIWRPGDLSNFDELHAHVICDGSAAARGAHRGAYHGMAPSERAIAFALGRWFPWHRRARFSMLDRMNDDTGPWPAPAESQIPSESFLEALAPEIEAPSDGAIAPPPEPEQEPEQKPEPELPGPGPAPPVTPTSTQVPTPRQPQRPPDAARCHRGLRPPVSEVWRYLSRPDLLRRWLGEVGLELAIGGEFALHAWNGDIVRGHVLQSDPPSTLAFTWKPHGTGTESRVAIRLQGDGPGTRITVRHEGLASEPERRQARRLWREVLGALRTTLHEDRDAHEWGASLPIAVRAPLSRSAADIWPLLSTAPGLEKWLAHVERFDGVSEGLFRFTSRYHGRQVVEEGTIELVAPESRVVLAWEWAGEAWGARTKVELSLEPDPSGSALLLLHSGFDKIAPEKAAIARREYAAAWPQIVADLRRFVAPLPV